MEKIHNSKVVLAGHLGVGENGLVTKQDLEDIQRAMIQFTKSHIKAQKEAYTNVLRQNLKNGVINAEQYKYLATDGLNAYPDSLIK